MEALPNYDQQFQAPHEPCFMSCDRCLDMRKTDELMMDYEGRLICEYCQEEIGYQYE